MLVPAALCGSPDPMTPPLLLLPLSLALHAAGLLPQAAGATPLDRPQTASLQTAAPQAALPQTALPQTARRQLPPTRAPWQPSATKPAPTLAELLRQLLRITPPMAVGGSRSGPALAVCVLSPLARALEVSPAAAGQALAIVPVATPTLWVAGELNELRLERHGELLWRQRATSEAMIRGPIAWPLPPLRAGERLLLRVRPHGAGGADFAEISLQAASADQLQRTAQLIRSLGGDAERWIAAIRESSRQDPALAIALASDPSAPPPVRAALAELAEPAQRQGCW